MTYQKLVMLPPSAHHSDLTSPPLLPPHHHRLQLHLSRHGALLPLAVVGRGVCWTIHELQARPVIPGEGEGQLYWLEVMLC